MAKKTTTVPLTASCIGRIRVAKTPEKTSDFTTFPRSIYRALIGTSFDYVEENDRFYVIDGDHYRAALEEHRPGLLAQMVICDHRIGSLPRLMVAKHLCVAGSIGKTKKIQPVVDQSANV